ncbi:UDP:flavonoid glycosyltransferase YjiC (YdhE family) [Rhodococcus sp. 27YEA15]|uniref:glycosyltransferase n=1 Tax=Rhodococcus sp. 27YEA15 TaxID=3156259 RepID=UPI003C7D05F4
MSSILLCSAPLTGHVGPMLAVGKKLREKGHTVSILTGRKFEKRAAAVGIEHIPLPVDCEFDEHDMESAFPGRSRKRGPLRARFDLEKIFIAAMTAQFTAVSNIIADRPVDAIAAENLFMGLIPMLGRSPDSRPPLFAICTSPLMCTSVDTAPFGPGFKPSATATGRIRNTILNAAFEHGILRAAQSSANSQHRSLTGEPIPDFALNWPLLADEVFVLTTPEFEYPRSDRDRRLTFAGPILESAGREFVPPIWWTDLDDDRPVVLVTQGTLDNGDLNRLIEPTIRGLADQDVLVVATTGGRPVTDVVTESANLRLAEFLPYDRLLPKVDVMVTNGGWGGVHYALAHGVPLVVSGTTEDKAEICRRVEISGTGINLRRSVPRSTAVAGAVRRVLDDTSFRDRARTLERSLAHLSAASTIATTIAARAN